MVGPGPVPDRPTLTAHCLTQLSLHKPNTPSSLSSLRKAIKWKPLKRYAKREKKISLSLVIFPFHNPTILTLWVLNYVFLIIYISILTRVFLQFSFSGTMSDAAIYENPMVDNYSRERKSAHGWSHGWDSDQNGKFFGITSDKVALIWRYPTWAY